MQQAEFERMLTQKQRKRRILEGILFMASLVLFLLCWNLREWTKEVTVHEGAYFIPDWEEVNYNNVYVPFIILGVIGAVMSGIFLLCDCLLGGFKAVQKDGQWITVYRGMFHNIVYVDGAEKGRMGPFAFSNVVEVWLNNGVRVTVSFGRTIWYIAHISFSDQTRSIEV